MTRLLQILFDALVVVLATVAACQPLPGPGPVPPTPDAQDAAGGVLDAAVAPPGAPDRCEEAYLHLVAVGCEPVAPATGSWLDVCRNGQRHGMFDTSCAKKAWTLPQAIQCGVDCGGSR